ncbi:hypothetical protein, partial [Escherichia coli]|uniref:hypothetical protein n=1 Tax=Escherichia coli TaxID=562 RepID=UPI00263D5223
RQDCVQHGLHLNFLQVSAQEGFQAVAQVFVEQNAGTGVRFGYHHVDQSAHGNAVGLVPGGAEQAFQYRQTA